MKRRLFISYIVIILFLSVFLGFFSISTAQNNYTDEFEESILKECHMLSDILKLGYAEDGAAYLDDFSREYSLELNYRITVVDSGGWVLADSDISPEILPNHSRRAEISRALLGREAISIRYSESLKVNMMYCAVPVQCGTENFIIRAAVPLNRLNSIRMDIMASTAIGALVLGITAFLIAAWFSGRITRPIYKLANAARDISEGGYGKQILLDEGGWELDKLAGAFNNMSSQLESTILELENENARLEAIVNSMARGVIAVDNEFRVMLINYISCEFFGLDADNVSGRNIYEIIRNENIFGLLDKSVEGECHIEGEFYFGGEEKIVRVFVNPIVNANNRGEVLGSLIVFEDVTRIRKLEKLRSDFVSNVTHELKTPLTSIMGFADTLKAGALNEPKIAVKFLDIIEIEAKRLYRLIMDILSLSEIETKQEDDNRENVDIADVVDNVYNMMAAQAEKKGIWIRVSAADGLPKFYCNRDRIYQMIVNLVDNAVKYTETGGVTIACDMDGDFLSISVSDTGIGIPDEARGRIFERFYRVDKGRSRKAGGTGLGLSIVKHIALLYNGTVAVYANEGGGSRFVVCLPYRRIEVEKSL